MRIEALQLLPERLALVRKTGTGWGVYVFGHPHGYIDGDGEAGDDRPLSSIFRAEVQRSARSDPDEIDWETIEDGTVATEPHHAIRNPGSALRLPLSYTAGYLFPGQQGKLADGVHRFVETRPLRLYYRKFRAPGAGGGNRGADRWRIRVTEWERHATDHAEPAPGQIPRSNERLIFAETFAI